MSNKPSATKIDTVIKLILIFCITLLSFSLGTFVGKQVSDSEYRKAAIEGEYEYFNAENESEQSEDDAEELSQKDIESLTDEFLEKESREIASEKKSATNKESAADDEKESLKKYVKSRNPDSATKEMAPMEKVDKKPPSMKAKKPIAEKKMDKKAQATPEAKRVAQDKSPTQTVKKVRKPQSVLPSVASSAVGKYTVQVASYASEQEAKSHSANLKEKGWNAFYVPANVRGRQWYRVSVGLFSTSTSAEKFKRDLVKDNAVNSAYVQKIVK